MSVKTTLAVYLKGLPQNTKNAFPFVCLSSKRRAEELKSAAEVLDIYVVNEAERTQL